MIFIAMPNDDSEPVKCVCQDCGKEFFRGDEGDNEKFCLKCEYRVMLEIDSRLDDVED